MKIKKAEIQIPFNVSLKKEKDLLLFKGPLGCSKLNVKKLDSIGSIAFSIDHEKKKITCITSKETLSLKIITTFITIIKNKIYGITQGYILYLRIVGIGYRCILQENSLIFKLGYSHDIKYKIPNSIRIFLLEPTLLCLFGVDKNQVTQIAAQIKKMKPPSPYKGKGIRFLQESVRLKQGKQK